MRLPNKAKLVVESHEYAMQRRGAQLDKYALWVACAKEHMPYYYSSPKHLTLWCPLDDADPPRAGDLEKAHACAAFAAGVLSSGQDVLVTCAMGLNRSALVAGLALRMLGVSGRCAVDNIRRERGRDALCNKAYEKVVLRG